MDVHTIRTQFITFFKKKKHAYVPAVPIVNHDDPGLFFINAGMNPFKNIFLGHQDPLQKEIVSIQPCLRVAGKHNDLEEVGVDTYHHTLFEMLGNWSFGSYFKKEAIAWAWELLTEVYKIDPLKLYATVFEGEKSHKLATDNQSYTIWASYLPKTHILYGSKKDNFWEMGQTGPCGPCTEIHIDLRANNERQNIPGALLVNTNHPQVVELWNIVFMQYNQHDNNLLTPLPMHHVDTGMGLERLAMVLQNKKSTYETDIFGLLIQAIAQKADTHYGKTQTADTALRVIADHIRSITFAIADGAIPSNQKAGYVVRRILRRALRYGYTHLNLKEPFLYQLVPQVILSLSKIYPSLQKQQSFIQKTICQEELTFIKTLSQGLKKLGHIIRTLSEKSTQIPGQIVFELYDTYGFPPDLTALIAREQGLTINQKDFEKYMKAQKTRSKKASTLQQSEWQIIQASTPPIFVGYDRSQTDSKLIKYCTVQKKDKTYYQLVLNKTPFYPEAGGQVGDTGYITTENKKIKVLDTQKENDLIIHYTTELPDRLKNPLVCTIDQRRRTDISRNHTATHLMSAAMTTILGKHITQQGSLVNEKGLRFDFTHSEKITPTRLRQIEQLVNEKIRTNLSLKIQEMPIAQAKKKGATAVFSEKYGKKVRVVTYGDYSSELCGGTHVQATGQIGFFKIKTEKGVRTGIRRIEALTGWEAEKWIQEEQQTLATICKKTKNTQDPIQAIDQLIEKNKKLRQDLDRLSQKNLATQQKQLQQKLQYIHNIYIGIEEVEVENPEELKRLAFLLNKINQPLFLVLATALANKPHLAVIISPTLTSHYHAQKIIKTLLPHIQGKGGGQAHFALASGQNIKGISKALQIAKNIFEEKISQLQKNHKKIY